MQLIFIISFEDNSGALEIAKLSKMRPHTKHIICDHFREYVRQGEITTHAININDMIADMSVKPYITSFQASQNADWYVAQL